MAEGSDELERLGREQLILKARVLGVERAELMTRVELRDEIVRRSEPDLAQQKRARGFLGVARDLVASVVEAGLNLPDAAKLIRGEGARDGEWKGPPPVATVTLAEIYAAQGHLDRALRMLDEVLAKEPDHDAARVLRDRLAAGADSPAPAPRKRQRVSFADPDPITLEPALSETESTLEPSTPIEHIWGAEPVTASHADSVPAAPPEPAEIPLAQVWATAPADSATPPAPTHAPREPVSRLEPVVASVSPDAPAEQIWGAEPAPLPVSETSPATVEAGPTAIEPASKPALDTGVAEPRLAAAPAPPPSVLTLALFGQRQVYWELPTRTFEALRTRSPGGRALLRVVSFRMRGDQVHRTTQDVSAEREVGSVVLTGLGADAVVRAVLGWEADGRFRPFIVASDLSSGTPSARRNAAFRPHHLVGSLAPGVEQRAPAHFAGRSSGS